MGNQGGFTPVIGYDMALFLGEKPGLIWQSQGFLDQVPGGIRQHKPRPIEDANTRPLVLGFTQQLAGISKTTVLDIT